MSKATNYLLSGGMALSKPPEASYDRNRGRDSTPGCRNWFLNGTFLYGRAGIDSGKVNEAITTPPISPALLTTTGGKARFASLTVEPTYRVRVGLVGVYVFGGAGWLRRTIEFTAPSPQGTLTQPVDPVSLRRSANSGVVGGGGGADIRLGGIAGGLKLFVDARYLQGVGANSRTALAPVTVGIRW